MAEVVAPGSQDQHRRHQQHPAHAVPQSAYSHGTKRAADTEPEGEQRLSKRFDLLNLDRNGTRLYIPVPGSADAAAVAAAAPPQQALSRALAKPVAPATSKKRDRKPRPPAPPADDAMQLEDTPDRVYIHDLAAELSDIESDEENPVFLADIEKHLAKIPSHILRGPELRPTKDNQLILYNVPSSLTVPEEQDKVRKAIVDARARIREKQASSVGEPERAPNGAIVPGTSLVESMPAAMDDPDAMELD